MLFGDLIVANPAPTWIAKLPCEFDRRGIGGFAEMAIGHISGRYIELQGSRKSSAGFVHLQPE
jgi:hypothetical protein